jgi:hypothetical protein
MPDSYTDFLDTLAKVLLWCWILGAALLFIQVGAGLLLVDVIHRFHGPMFGLSSHELDVIIYSVIALFRVFVIVFFFTPWLAIKLVLRKLKA